MDRISLLPDEILLHITSFLSTEEAFRTSVLSRRWENVWTHLTRLDFYSVSRSFPTGPPPPKFVRFVDRVLNRLNSRKIESFNLTCFHKFYNPGHAAEWVNQAFSRNPSEVKIILYDMELPLNFFNCESLTVLELSSSGSSFFTVPEAFCFPNLKSLKFHVDDPPTELTEIMFRICPKLEFLVIQGQVHHGELIYDIFSESLKKLEIDLWEHGESELPTVLVLLQVPNLERLIIKDEVAAEYVVKGSLTPDETTVSLGEYCTGDCAYKLLEGINSSKSLSLHEYTFYVLSDYHDGNLPTFECFVLDLEVPGWCDWNFFFDLLHSTPKLKVLRVHKECDHYCLASYDEDDADIHEDKVWNEPHLVPKCLLEHLEVIEICGYYKTEYDLKAVEYLLKNAQALRKLVIHRPKLAKASMSLFLRKLCELPRASCEIQFLNVSGGLIECGC